ncbi:hypothetical protein RF55_23522 [Lasius niger]|uniref:Uncharacterized protein n=1 Tax=Lasius niger TaxID=67767 RepID=A0A0J7MNV8_LASNI|nr:hypothetical protein RF55_23522 [Lasius niger]
MRVSSKKQKTNKRPLEKETKQKETDGPTTKEKIHNSELSLNSLSLSSSVSGSITISESILKNRYSKLNQSPFDVNIQRISNSRAPLHPITIDRIIQHIFKNILKFKKIGFSKVSIFLITREAANQLVNDQRLQKKDLVALIPLFRTSCKGIIRNVPIDFSEQVILEKIFSSINVKAVNRLNRKIIHHKDKNKEKESSVSQEYAPSLSVAITFEGQKLPKHITLFYVRYPVRPEFIVVSQISRFKNFLNLKWSF